MSKKDEALKLAWGYVDEYGEATKFKNPAAHKISAYDNFQLLYTTPPATPVPLTDGQVEQIYKEQTGSFIDDSPWALMDFVRAIEAAHGITKGEA